MQFDPMFNTCSVSDIFVTYCSMHCVADLPNSDFRFISVYNLSADSKVFVASPRLHLTEPSVGS